MPGAVLVADCCAWLGLDAAATRTALLDPDYGAVRAGRGRRRRLTARRLSAIPQSDEMA